MDESHEVAYKQFESNPRYHARDAAVVLAGLHQAKIVMGSASPSIESSHNSRIGKYNLVEIKERYRGFSMPAIETVDLKISQKKKQMKGHFSQTLIDAISKTIAAQEQVILFQNRRGFSSFVQLYSLWACAAMSQLRCEFDLSQAKRKTQMSLLWLPCIESCPLCGMRNCSPQTDGIGNPAN